MLGKRHRKTLRKISVFVLLTDTRIRKMSVVGEVTVSYPFTAVHRRLRTVSIDLGLSKNDFIQQKTSDVNKIPLLIQLCNQYPIIYDILWALSFNIDVQKRLCSSTSFMSNLTHLDTQGDNEQMRKSNMNYFGISKSIIKIVQ